MHRAATFNTAFYETAATVMPIFWVAIAVELRVLRPFKAGWLRSVGIVLFCAAGSSASYELVCFLSLYYRKNWHSGLSVLIAAGALPFIALVAGFLVALWGEDD
ncbi:MAG: hypothetical protein JWM85_3493 [Acidimicrobiaceae bacterium]|nr:hypothetical protein [Acidimicrobiaceae bacterium]